MKKAIVTALCAGGLMALSATTASAAAGWQETYRDFDSKLSCDLSALTWEAKDPANDYQCFQLGNGRWTMKYRLK
ncbi:MULTISPECIES: hypothetical protein [Streptomyces]|uniref:hypothetical protein n=1 Tax=Streptomyces TaxID=1883 RepID=UPI001F226A22|nr:MULTISPECIES: hypothetical protein [Streptomyces]MCF2131724.1 hypothetical protein [Streptomyces sp. STD 3.1]WFB88512.1 hypothetical protein MMU79_37370 [Streptomyces olivaceus]WGK50655.1 hypothetical protein M6G09_36395 [Streptomyces sp. B146]